jgi:hypothetical protein
MTIFINNKYTKWYNSIISNAKSRISIQNEYYESHHILPRAAGGDDSYQNLVRLTAREHFICHLLLPRMLNDPYKSKMRFALWMLSNGKNSFQQRYKCNSRIYEIVKKEFSIAASKLHKGKILSQETKDKLSIAHKGKKLSKEHKEKINPRGRILSQETKDKISQGQIGRIGGMKNKHHSEETKKKISSGNVGKIMPPMTQERKDQVSKQFLGSIQSAEHKAKRLSSRKERGYYKDEASTKRKMSESAKNRPKYKCHCGKECSPSNFKRWHGENCKLPHTELAPNNL